MKGKFLKKVLSTLMVVSMMAGSLAGCGTSNSDTQSSQAEETGTESTAETVAETIAETAIDTSETVNLVGYLIGEAPAGLDAVMEKVNERLMDEINCTVEIRYLSWGEYVQKYPLILAAGEDVDFIFTASWCMYAQEAQKYAFHEITLEDLQTYMPRHYELIKDTPAYEQSLIDGSSYMITTSTPDKKVPCIVYRKDLADKYGIGEINSIGDFTSYFEAIKENEPDMYPMYLDSQYDLTTPFGALVAEYGDGYEDIVTTGAGLYWTYEEAATGSVTLCPIYEGAMGEAAKYAISTLKEWYDAGYINKDVFSNDVRSKDAFLEGKSAIGFGNSIDMATVLSSAASQGYECGIVKIVDKAGHSGGEAYIANGVAVAESSEYPERTMMALDLMMEDEEIVNLLYYGIEGVNYVETEDGKIGLPDGVTDETNDYPADGAGFWFINRDIPKPSASWTDEYVQLKEEVADCLVYHNFTGYSVDRTNIETELANMQNVMTQYAYPMFVGMVDDVDEGIATLQEKLEAAGIETAQEEIQIQIDAYMEE